MFVKGAFGFGRDGLDSRNKVNKIFKPYSNHQPYYLFN